jgi:hypothetical protein
MFFLFFLLAGGLEWQHLPVEFKRQTFVKDPRHDITLFAHLRSPESALLHFVVLFGNKEKHFHNALSINPASLGKVARVTRDRGHEFGLALPLTTRDSHLWLPYTVGSTEFWASRPQYDGALSLDYFSGLWTAYDRFIIERTVLRLEHSLHDPPTSLARHKGRFSLQCDFFSNFSTVKHCLVLVQGPLVVNGVNITYPLRIDLTSPRSTLPQELYIRWAFGGEKEFLLSDDTGEILFLNSQFQWDLGSEFLIGVDLVHHFQRVEFQVHQGLFTLWYNHIYRPRQTWDWGAFAIALFVGAMVLMLGHWFCSPSYDVLVTVLQARARGKPSHQQPFAYSQVLCEVLACISSIVLWILSFAIEAPLERQLLLFFFSLAHFVMQLCLFGRNWAMVRGAWNYYYARGMLWWNGEERRPWDPEGYDALVKAANRHSYVLPVRFIIARNIVIQALLISNLLLIFNTTGEGNTLNLVFFVIFGLILTFSYAKQLYIGFIDLLAQHSLFVAPLYFFLLLACFVIYVIFLAFLIKTALVPFLQAINALFAYELILGYVLTLVALAIVAGLFLAFLPVLWYALRKKSTPGQY